MENCTQGERIAKMETILENIAALLAKHEKREDDMMLAMNKLATQQEIIHFHAQTLTRHEDSINEAFVLIRGHDKAHADEIREEDKQKTLLIRMMESPAGGYVAGVFSLVVLTGFIIDVIVHFSLVKKIWDFVRG